MKNKMKIIHWVSTGLISLLYIMSASMYLFNHDMVSEMFGLFGFPTWIIYPLAAAKLLAVFTLISKFKAFVVEWAYAGILFNLLLAIGAHTAIGDGEAGGAIVGLVLWFVSYVTWKKMK